MGKKFKIVHLYCPSIKSVLSHTSLKPQNDFKRKINLLLFKVCSASPFLMTSPRSSPKELAYAHIFDFII
jgi:hypothetical protein